MTSILSSILYSLTFDFLPKNYDFLTKSLSIFLLIFFIFSSSTLFKGRNFAIYALFCSGLGDIFLTFQGEQYFLTGVFFFLIAHVFYILIFLSLLKKPFFLTGYQKHSIVFIILFSLFALIFVSFFVSGLLKFSLYLYTTIITLMICTAAMLKPFPSQIFIGAVLFGISDTLLGTSIFVFSYPGQAYFIWFSYYLAQIFMVNGILNLHNFKNLFRYL